MLDACVQTREDDVNGDGLYDQLDFQLSMPLQNTEQVTSVELMLFFNYILQVLCQKFVLLFWWDFNYHSWFSHVELLKGVSL